MFSWMRRKSFVLVVSLMCGALLGPRAVAGSIPIGASQIDGEYMNTNLGQVPDNPPNFPVSFSLFSGEVTGPTALTSFGVPNMGVTVDPYTTPSSTLTDETTSTSEFTLSGGASGTVTYIINSASVEGSNLIQGEMTLQSNTTNFDFTGFNTALLSLYFEPGVSFDPHWSGFDGPVYFQISGVPEPASILHLMWVGALGVVGYWEKRRRAVRALPV